MADENEGSKIHIDSDWKAQAQAEKQKLAEQSKAKPAAGKAAPGQGEMPPANFETLISTMATQALLYMGGIPDPRSGQRYMMPDLARHHIDMLSVIEEKSKGNLSEEETTMLATTLYELRNRYIQVINAQRQQGGA